MRTTLRIRRVTVREPQTQAELARYAALLGLFVRVAERLDNEEMTNEHNKDTNENDDLRERRH